MRTYKLKSSARERIPGPVVAPLLYSKLSEWQNLLRHSFSARWGSLYLRRRFFRDYVTHDPHYRSGRILGLYVEGRLVSTCQVFRRRVVVGNSIFKLDGLGNIGTHPAVQGRGYGSSLLRWYLERERGRPDVALLYARHGALYQKLGWQAVTPGRLFLRKPLWPTGTLERGAAEWRPIHTRDLKAIGRLYNTFNRLEAHPYLVRSLAYWRDWVLGWKLGIYGLRGRILMAKGEPIGYVFYRAEGKRMLIDEYAALPSACEQVFGELLWIFRNSRANLLEVTRPTGSLEQFLQQRGMAYERIVSPDELAHVYIFNPTLRTRTTSVALWHADHF